MNLSVQVRNLVKNYGDRVAVDGVSFDVKSGECFGLLGPNGAGKTTLLRMISAQTEITSGDLFVRGLSQKVSPQEIKNRIGIVPQGDNLDLELTVEENLLVFCGYLGLPKAEATSKVHALLREVGLADRFDQIAESLSGGYRKRLALVRSLLNSPDLIVLDEPTVALDPQARIWTWSFLKKQKSLGNTLILTTHYMEEAESLCDRVALINDGKLVDIGSPQELIEKYWGCDILELNPASNDKDYYLKRVKESKLEHEVFVDRILIQIPQNIDSVEVLKKFEGLSFSLRPANLNDVFLKVAGLGLAEDAAGLEENA